MGARRSRAMASALSLREDYSAAELRRLAAATRNANQSRRLLSLAGVLDGMNRMEAARIGGMDRQTLRDWVHRFNAHGPEGLLDSWSKGPEPRLSAEQRAEIAELVETGPDRAVHGVVRWRRVDLQGSFSSASVSLITSARSASSSRRSASRTSAPAHITRRRMRAPSRRSKKLPGPAEGPSGRSREAKADRGLVPG
jgi:transposase